MIYILMSTESDKHFNDIHLNHERHLIMKLRLTLYV